MDGYLKFNEDVFSKIGISRNAFEESFIQLMEKNNTDTGDRYGTGKQCFDC
jgi:hypothetical protein